MTNTDSYEHAYLTVDVSILCIRLEKGLKETNHKIFNFYDELKLTPCQHLGVKPPKRERSVGEITYGFALEESTEPYSPGQYLCYGGFPKKAFFLWHEKPWGAFDAA